MDHRAIYGMDREGETGKLRITCLNINKNKERKMGGEVRGN